MESFDRKTFMAGLVGGLLTPHAYGQARLPETSPMVDANVKSYGAKGDGKHDDTAAFARCLATAKLAYVPAGTYLLRQLRLDGHTLYGEGTLKTDQENVLVITGSGARVTGLRFATVNNRARAEIRLGEGCQNVEIDHCHFTGQAYSALAADKNGKNDSELLYKKPAGKVRFSSNHVQGYVVSVYMHSVADLLIQGNYFSDSFYDAIRLRQAVERVIITNNMFSNIGISKEEVSRDAIDSFWSGRELIISHNIVKGTGCIGFDLKGHEPSGRYFLRNVLVIGNQIEDTNYSGILVSAGGVTPGKKSVGPISIQSNILSGCNRKGQNIHDAAIWLHHGCESVQVSNNQINGHQGHGISFTNAMPGAPTQRLLQIHNNLIRGCRFKKEAAGLFGQEASLVQIRGNLVEDCDLTWGLERIGLPERFRQGSQIEGNLFVGVGKATPPLDWLQFIAKNNRVVAQ